MNVINNTISAFIDPQQAKIEGSLSLQKTDYNALIFREKFGTKTNENNIEKLNFSP